MHGTFVGNQGTEESASFRLPRAKTKLEFCMLLLLIPTLDAKGILATKSA